MSEKYAAISWNRQKKIYDLIVAAGIGVYISLFISVGGLLHPTATAETLIIRAFGTCALLLLHIVLVIGPLCRLSPRFLPLLYNRRHLGVATFLIAAVHGIFGIIQFHTGGVLDPLVSVFVGNTRFSSLPDFPFQLLGFGALVILFLMAATSHDFWLNNLTAPVWKTLHTLVYAAYGLLIGHVALGVLQSETSPLLAVPLGLGLTIVVSLHLIAGFKELPADSEVGPDRDCEFDTDGYIQACSVEEIPEKRACIRTIAGERVAIFKYENKISAVSNVCQHQNGPLGEGRIGADGCITCPWHGFQYNPATGASPLPFTEKLPTFNVKIVNGAVFIDTRPNPAGTYTKPAEF